MKVVITGSSGMVGQGVLLECLVNSSITDVLVINRKPIASKHPKINEVLIDNFFKLDSIKQQLTGYDACYFCIGISGLGKDEAEYSKTTYNLTINFAKVFLEQNSKNVFCYVSGAGTDSTEKRRTMWARVKGKTENTLLKMPFKSAYMFRPGYIQPLKGVKSRTNWYSLIYKLLSPIYLILKHFPSSATNTINIGKAMIKVVEGNYSNNILNNKEINEIVKE